MMLEILHYLDLSVFAELSLILFGGVFLGVLIRVIRTPRKEMDALSRMALTSAEPETALSRQDGIAGGRP